MRRLVSQLHFGSHHTAELVAWLAAIWLVQPAVYTKASFESLFSCSSALAGLVMGRSSCLLCWVCRLPASDNPEVFKAQQTMFEAWSIVGK